MTRQRPHQIGLCQLASSISFTGRIAAALAACAALIVLSSCASSASMDTDESPTPDMSASAPSPDPRIGLRAGWYNAAQAIWNLRVVSMTHPSAQFTNPSTPGEPRLVNSDLSFVGPYVFQGNYSGYQVWDISNPRKLTLHTAYVCPGSQTDVSIYRNLLFTSSEATNSRLDCGMQGVPDTVSEERARGIRVFDISDVAHPKLMATVQTCRGSHTHTVVTDPSDNANVYVYVSGSAAVRSPKEMPGCSNAQPSQDPNTALFRIEVIRVPLAHPEQAALVSSPRIFENLTAPARHGESHEDSVLIAAARAKAGVPPATPATTGPTQCHDITVYPAIGLAGGACGGYGLLLDIHDVANPKRIAAVSDYNFSFWHSATFNNDGTKILFSDEWGGGSQPRCRVTDKPEWGADAIFSRVGDKMTFQSYYKIPDPQLPVENCVAHNGSLIPVPGRDIMVQAWYQGGLSVFDWTDAAHPKEIAYFDRGPMDSTKLILAGYWSTYWYNGYIFASEITRGIDVFQLKPSPFLSKNEIDAAKLVHFDFLNVQSQPKLVWPASFVVARAYLDQLTRDKGIPTAELSSVATELGAAEKMSGAQRSAALNRLASELDSDAAGASDAGRVHLLAGTVRDLAGLQH